MADIELITQILNISKFAQFKAANDVAIQKALKGGFSSLTLPEQIYVTRMSIQYRYNVNPSDPTLRSTTNYLKRLCGNYYIMAQNDINNIVGLPVVSGPSNQTVTVGSTAIFTLTITSSTSITIAWYKNGVLIPGETSAILSFTAQSGDTGSSYYAVVSNSSGSVPSATATLTVTSSLVGSYYYGATDYYSDLQNGNDNVPYQGTFAITNGQPFQITLPSAAANNVFEIFRVPIGQSAKTIWFNTALNQGTFPDSVFYASFTLGSYRYYCSRVEMSIDTSLSPNMILS
jgi:hypothetical protein